MTDLHIGGGDDSARLQCSRARTRDYPSFQTRNWGCQKVNNPFPAMVGPWRGSSLEATVRLHVRHARRSGCCSCAASFTQSVAYNMICYGLLMQQAD